MAHEFKKCEILDDEEMENQKALPYNFRRFEVEELQRRSSPFEKSQKKEFPFLFQKKKPRVIEEKKISIDELMKKVNDIKLDDTQNCIINDEDIKMKEYKTYTPEYPKTEEEFDKVHNEIVEHYNNLKENKDKMEEENEHK